LWLYQHGRLLWRIPYGVGRARFANKRVKICDDDLQHTIFRESLLTTSQILHELRAVLLAIELLELTPREIAHARVQLIQRITPASISPESLIERWFKPAPLSFTINAE
jgi:hypothetical protein